MQVLGLGHELGHGIAQRGGKIAYSNLAVEWATETRLGRAAGGFAITGGWQQSSDPGENEVFADMFLGWTYNQWNLNIAAGVVKSQYMQTNMPGVIALAVAAP